MTLRACVIGHPVSHSKSPLIHQYWLDKYNLKGAYDVLDIAPENLEEEVRGLVKKKYSGFNVTIPYKEEIFNLCDVVDVSAKKIGAINTVAISGVRMRGLNTDSFGFIENIKAAQPGFKFSGASAVILGAGGAARAAVAGLLEASAGSVKILNRTRERAEKIAEDFADKRISIIDWDARSEALKNANLLANTTALGMTGQPPLEISLDALPLEATVCDIVYAPHDTALLQVAKMRGNKIAPGIGMLLHQARPAFKAWTGIMPKVTDELIEMVSK